MFLIPINSQINYLSIVGVVLGLKNPYQCGGETLVPVVKHSVSDSTLFRNWCQKQHMSNLYADRNPKKM